MIVLAYAKGDRKTLKTFLAKDVFDGFAQAITDREGRGETAETTFVSIDKADLIAAEMRDKFAHVTVSFGSKIITAVRDRAGAVVDGSADKIVDVNDIWTFARDTDLARSELEAGGHREQRLSLSGFAPWRGGRPSP